MILVSERMTRAHENKHTHSSQSTNDLSKFYAKHPVSIIIIVRIIIITL